MGDILDLLGVKKYVALMIDERTQGKSKVLEICQWLQEWDKGLDEAFHIIAYKRDKVNVGFTTTSNQYKKKKPGFMVMKFSNTDIEFKEPHFDFYLGAEGYPKHNQWLKQRGHPSHVARWVLLANKWKEIPIDVLKQIITNSFEKRFSTQTPKQKSTPKFRKIDGPTKPFPDRSKKWKN